MASNVTQTVKKVHVCASESIFSVQALTTNFGWTTHHIYVGEHFLFSVGTATSDVATSIDGSTREENLAEAVAFCDSMPKRKFRGDMKATIERVRASVRK